MTEPNTDGVYTRTVAAGNAKDANVATEYAEFGDLSLPALLNLVEHGDPRAAEELMSRAVELGLEQGVITQADLDGDKTEEPSS